MVNHPNRSQSATRKAMRLDGYKAFRVLCQDSNGGLPLMWGWCIVQSDIAPRAGEIVDGFPTQQAAWSVAEDVFDQEIDAATR